jgi:hypothetical protein
MASLPAEISYGTITGRIITAVKDTLDGPDTLPDSVPATGFVTFAPTSLLVSLVSDVIILPQPIVCALDTTGYFTVDLVSTDDPDISPINWAYNVSFTVNQGAIPSQTIYVPAGVTRDLSDVVLAGTPPTPAQIDTLTARVAYLESRPKLYVQTTAPTSPSVNDIWVKI